jgi:hypothetical protein
MIVFGSISFNEKYKMKIALWADINIPIKTVWIHRPQ